jgi:ribokinase
MPVLAFGSINLDLTVRVPRLPGAGETVLGPGLLAAPGGKGANQALAARRAGAEVRLIGAVGRDAFAAPALALLEAAGVDLGGVAALDGAATGVALIAVAESGENQIAVAQGANARARADAVPEAWLGPDTVLSLTLEVPVAESLKLAQRAAARRARVVLNAAPAAPVPAALLGLVDVLIVNQHEAPVVAGTVGAGAASPEDCARALARALKAAVVVTLGAAGALAVKGGEAWRVPALAIERAVDTTGAGDAFAGALAAALDAKLDLPAALARAAVAGALACTRAGAQPALPSAAEIDAALKRLGPVERAAGWEGGQE